MICRDRVAQQADRQHPERDHHQHRDVPAQHPDRAQRPDGERSGHAAGDQHTQPARQQVTGQRLQPGGDHQQLEDRPADALRDVENRRQHRGFRRRAGRGAAPSPGRRSGHPAPATCPESCRRAPSRRRWRSPRRRRLSGSTPNGVRIDRAPAKPSRLTPRLPQKPSWSSSPRVRGGASASVNGASLGDARPCRPGRRSASAAVRGRDMADYLSLRRYEPDQVQAVGGPPVRCREPRTASELATLSAQMPGLPRGHRNTSRLRRIDVPERFSRRRARSQPACRSLDGPERTTPDRPATDDSACGRAAARLGGSPGRPR